jgi:hypothetical protein
MKKLTEEQLIVRRADVQKEKMWDDCKNRLKRRPSKTIEVMVDIEMPRDARLRDLTKRLEGIPFRILEVDGSSFRL